MALANCKKVSEVRQLVAGGIDTVLSAAGWKESPVAYDRFVQLTGDNLMDQGYAVGCPRSRPYVREGHPVLVNRPTDGLVALTEVHVAWSSVLSAGDQLTAYDEALDNEALIIGAVLSVHKTAGVHLYWDEAGSSRVVDEESDHVIGDTVFLAKHRFATA